MTDENESPTLAELIEYAGTPMAEPQPTTWPDHKYWHGIESALIRLRDLETVIAKCGPVTSEVRDTIGHEGGWVKARLPTARDVMNAHAMLAGRFDLIDQS